MRIALGNTVSGWCNRSFIMSIDLLCEVRVDGEENWFDELHKVRVKAHVAKRSLVSSSRNLVYEFDCPLGQLALLRPPRL